MDHRLWTVDRRVVVYPCSIAIRTGSRPGCRPSVRFPSFTSCCISSAISAGAYAWTVIAYGQPVNISFNNGLSKAYEFSLWRIYLVWSIVVASLYFPCRWYGDYRKKT